MADEPERVNALLVESLREQPGFPRAGSVTSRSQSLETR